MVRIIITDLQKSTHIPEKSDSHIRQNELGLLSCSQKDKGEYDYAYRSQNTACLGVVAARGS